MSAAVFRTETPSLSVPQSQNTAPVLEFNCLYTHDVRKKQKKWQDGFLRYHTFNKRVMVYDVPRNFVGDVHWKSTAALQEGDELALDDGTVMVEVGENVGSVQTDLTELRSIAKRSTREGGSSSSPARPPITGNRSTPSSVVRNQAPLKHRSLNALLGSSRGQVGRASLPSQSPFELRRTNDENANSFGPRPAKRAKVDNQAAGTSSFLSSAVRPMIDNSTSRQSKKPSLDPGTSRLNPREAVPEFQDADPRLLPSSSSEPLGLPSSPPGLDRRPISRDRSVRSGHEENSALDRRPTANEQPAPAVVQQQSPFFAGERATLKFAPIAPKRRMLLCESQFSDKASTTPMVEPVKTQQQILKERLDRINKKPRKSNSQKVSSTVAGHSTPRSGTNGEPIMLDQEDVQDLPRLENRAKPSLLLTDRPEPPTIISTRTATIEERTLRRTVSDCEALLTRRPNREPGAPVRISAPSRAIPVTSRPAAPDLDINARHPPTDAQTKRTVPPPRTKVPPQRSVSLNMTGTGTSTVMLRRQFQPPAATRPPPPAPEPPVQPDAWSREAFDLFEWRPPDWDEENWRVRESAGVE